MNGYAGKILHLDLTRKQIMVIPTSKYKEWVGGHGMGSAIFFDLVKDKSIEGFDPANVVTMMTSPLSGTLTPGASARTEVQGIGVQSYPIGWFTRSNFGGRFSSMLKYAGWDGVVIQGKAPEPVWIDIRNGEVKIRACAALDLWGRETWESQDIIWDYVAGKGKYGDWIEPTQDKDLRTTQRPAVVTIGPAGENLSTQACLIHDASNAAGQGGFGAVWGSKNLKAISVIGTGSFKISNPKDLMKTRLWQKNNYAFDLDNLKTTQTGLEFQTPPLPHVLWQNRRGRPKNGQKPQACIGCHSGCRGRYEDKLGNEASCFATVFYWDAKTVEIQRKASDLINRFGLNAVEMCYGLLYIYLLYRNRQLGKDDIPECPLDFSVYGSLEFVEQFVRMMAYGNDGRGGKSRFGEDVAKGFVRASKKWGRLEKDLKNGMLLFPFWGLPIHKEPRAQVYWGYGTILPITQIISSTSRRAIETIEGLGLETGVTIELDDRLCERRLSNTVLPNFMDAVGKTWQDFYFSHPGGETNRRAQNRAISLLKELQFKTENEHVVLSTHGNLLALILNQLNTSYGFNFWRSLTMPDIYQIDPAGVIERLWKVSL